MEKNDFLRLNEVIYHIHTCRDLDDLKRTILSQLKFIIPYSYASLIAVTIDPDTRAIRHSDPFCLPPSFQQVEEEWTRRDDQDASLWLSHAPESVVVRASEVMAQETWVDRPVYQDLYRAYHIHDTLTMNLAYDHHVMALLTLYRTRADGAFTDQEAFYLRSLSNHINFAYFTQRQAEKTAAIQGRTLAELCRAFSLTRREEEVLALVFQEKSNDEILDQLSISRNTLLKHLQNLYRKCGVSSRWELFKLREGSYPPNSSI